VIPHAEVSHRSGQILVLSEGRAPDVIRRRRSRPDRSRRNDGVVVGASADVLAILKQRDASSSALYDEGNRLPGVSRERRVGADLGLTLVVGRRDGGSQLRIARDEDVAIPVTVGSRVADTEDEVVILLLLADKNLDADRDGVLVAHQVVGELNIVVDAIKTDSIRSLKLGAVYIAPVAVVTAEVGGLLARGLVEGKI